MRWPRRRRDEDFDDEVQAHLAIETDRLIAEGLTPDQARAASRRAFGNVTRARERFYDSRRVLWLDDLQRDVRYALRTLVRNPGFAAAAVLTLGLGIGGTAAIFSIVDGVLLRPLPYDDPERLVAVAEEHPGGTSPFGGVVLTNLTYAAWADEARTIDEIGAYATGRGPLTGSASGDAPQWIDATFVTPSLFRVLRMAPAAGRLFHEEDAREGAASVVVLAHAFWRSRFGGDASVIGRTVTLDGEPHAIVGVAPAGFVFPGPSQVDVYGLYRVPWPEANPDSVHALRVVARLAPGITPSEAAAEATAAARRVERPRSTALMLGEGGPVDVRVQPLLKGMTARIRPALLLLMAGTGLVLLIACANVANLLLSRGIVRARELAVRAALGGGRRRLLRQLLTESLVVSSLGGALGVLIGWALVSAMPALAPANVPRLDDIRVDLRFLGVACVISIAAGVIAGALPALRGSAAALAQTMRESDARTGGGPSGRIRALLLATEAALAVMLLVGAVLLGRSFVALTQVDAGYDPARVLVATLHFTGASREPGRGPAALDRILERVRARPGVVAAGAGIMAPFSGMVGTSGFDLPGRTGPDGGPLTVRALTAGITPGYAEALGMRLQEGRFFEERDGWQAGADEDEAVRPRLVNEAFVRAYLDDGQPVAGREERFGSGRVEIVGVVDNVLPGQLDRQPEPQIYVPPTPDARIAQTTIVVRMAGHPAAFAPTLRALVHEMEPTAALEAVEPLGARVWASMAQPRFATSVLGAFGLLAVLLAATGLYGVLSFTVSQRQREMGIRAALGADRGRLMALVLRQGLGATAAGLVAGLAGAAILSRLLEGLLFGVSPLDALSFVAASVLLGLVALAACLVPALRASRVDPAESLRTE